MRRTCPPATAMDDEGNAKMEQQSSWARYLLGLPMVQGAQAANALIAPQIDPADLMRIVNAMRRLQGPTPVANATLPGGPGTAYPGDNPWSGPAPIEEVLARRDRK